ncbi:MAG: hypothetical protein GX638_02420 [Crenarchaeota archaeon]|nr:hypothetical protein [Thermoproteota archaeon]
MDINLNKDTNLANSADCENFNKFIRCPECGEQIPMVPALSDMIAIIEEHISSHKEQTKTNLIGEKIKTPCLRQDLTEQVIIQASMIRETPKDSTWIELE